MALVAGTRLGPYEVVSLIGVGGMGEVYRARDTKLGRDVAVKILPDLFASDPERLARFEREAQVLASLNHPNIAAIYGLEEAGGTKALVLELVEGPTLAEVIAQTGRSQSGSLPRVTAPNVSEARQTVGVGPHGVLIEDALAIARQIAEALEVAHEQGVVHRDLKPANIKIRPDGIVKVLDFGLAKLADPAGSAAGAHAVNTMSPTMMSVAATRAGMILGTAAYMAPEQARGKSVDRRADNWAFGCVLYEMLTGRRPFGGDEISDTLAFILTKEPDWSALPADTPAAIRRLLRRCLEKDRAQRLQHIGDARLDIREALTAPVETVVAAQPVVASDAVPATRAGLKTGLNAKIAWAAAVLFFATTLALAGVMYVRSAPVDAKVTRFAVSPPEGWSLTLDRTRTTSTASPAALAVSPDGRRIAFLANRATGRSRLWVRALDTLTAQELPGTEGASSPFWSPDSRSLGFFADGKLKRIDAAGGQPVTLCDSPDNRGGTWNPDGVIVFSPGFTSALQKVSASGGVPSAASVLSEGETGHTRPSFLPDGRHFIHRSEGKAGIYVASLDSSERTLVIENPEGSNVVYAQGHLFFLRETTLMTQPFDANRLVLIGEPVPVAEQIQTTLTPPYAYYSASTTGVLVYQTGRALVGSQLTWFDRSGEVIETVGDQAFYGDVELSPDGRRASVSVVTPAGTRDIWTVDLARGTRQRLTSDPASETVSAWSPDGSRIIFNSSRKGNSDLYQKASSGVGAEDTVLETDGNQLAYSWSRDGRYALYQTPGMPPTVFDLWVLPLLGDKKPVPFLQTSFSKLRGRFSPDGRWVSYDSNESERTEVYVAPYPRGDAKTVVSTAGGSWSRWRRDGREIFYLAPDNQLMAVEVDGQGPTFRVSAARPLFTITSPGAVRYAYDVSPDGQRFLVNTPPEPDASAPITVVMNWQVALGARERP